MRRPRWLRWGPLGTFALVTLVALVLIDLGAGVLARDLVADQVRHDAEDIAVAVTRLGLEPQLTPADLTGGATLTEERRDEVDAAVLDGLARSGALRLTAWDVDGALVYSTDPRVTAPPPAVEEDLAAGLRGEVSSRVLSPREAGGVRAKVLVVFVPVRAEDGAFTDDEAAPIVGAIGVALPYAPLQASVTDGTRRIVVTVGLLLGALYVVLLALVLTASRRLRDQVRTNRRQARHDGLTDLPNLVVLREELAGALAAGHTSVVVGLIDLDGFREVNDALGHRHGDTVLVHVGQRLRAAAPEGATVARLGGDEFAVVLPGRRDAPEAVAPVLAAVQGLVEVGDLEIEVRATAGAAVAPTHGTTPDDLLARAEVALFQAKADRSGVAVYDASRDEHTTRRLALAGELRRALDHRELVVHFQAKLDLLRREVVGVEALVRWQHPTLGLLPPADFMPVVESTSLIRPLTAFVIDEALACWARWRDEGLDLEVSVNLAAGSLHDLDLPAQVAAALARHGAPAEVLVLELTETTLLVDPVRARAVLEELHGLGVRVAIDDFGTGYASLSYLRDLPVDELKIDQSFIRNVAQRGEDAGIVEFSIALAGVLGLVVVAEGVEDEAVIVRLAELGCDQAQGFHVARPCPAEGIAAIVASFPATGTSPTGPV